MNGKEMTRTPRYMLMTRERGTSLFMHLLVLRREVVKLRAHTDALRDQMREQTDLLNLALHQLAAERGKEPLLFTRAWLAAERAPATKRGGEAREER